jgi:hypothetical protein
MTDRRPQADGSVPSGSGRVIDRARSYWEALLPGSGRGAWVNVMMETDQGRFEAAYGENYSR